MGKRLGLLVGLAVASFLAADVASAGCHDGLFRRCAARRCCVERCCGRAVARPAASHVLRLAAHRAARLAGQSARRLPERRELS